MSQEASRRRARTLARICDEALALVSEGGVDGLTMAGLAERVDYSPPALYRYFASKGALLAELNRRVLADVRGALRVAWEAAPHARAAVRATARVVADEAAARPEAFGLVAISLADPRHLVDDERPAHLPELEALIGELAVRIHEATAAGDLRPGDPAQRALRLLFGVVGALQLVKLERYDARIDARAVAEGLADDLLGGWSVPREGLQEDR